MQIIDELINLEQKFISSSVMKVLLGANKLNSKCGLSRTTRAKERKKERKERNYKIIKFYYSL